VMEEFYRVMVCLCVVVKAGQWRDPGPLGGCLAKKKSYVTTAEYLFGYT
jgi:hypothetical protein